MGIRSRGRTGHRIEPTGMKRVTSAKAPDRKPAALESAESVNRFQSVVGTARMESALIADERAERHLINTDQRPDDRSGQRCGPESTDSLNHHVVPAAVPVDDRAHVRTPSSSSSSATNLSRCPCNCSRPIGATTRTTISTAGSLPWAFRNRSRMIRLIRFRALARATDFFPTMRPSRACCILLKTTLRRNGPARSRSSGRLNTRSNSLARVRRS